MALLRRGLDKTGERRAWYHLPRLFHAGSATLNRNKLLNRENLFALGLCLLVILLLVVTADSAPQWIYQGF